MPTVADDSGLAVDALGGRPGVHSKRWSGRGDLTARRSTTRTIDCCSRRCAASRIASASYVCAAAFVDDAREIVSPRRGGRVRSCDDARGAHGFGYDPYFFSRELGRTFGEASAEEKERVSHRGRAFRALLARSGRECVRRRLMRRPVDYAWGVDTFEGSRGVA